MGRRSCRSSRIRLPMSWPRSSWLPVCRRAGARERARRWALRPRWLRSSAPQAGRALPSSSGWSRSSPRATGYRSRSSWRRNVGHRYEARALAGDRAGRPSPKPTRRSWCWGSAASTSPARSGSGRIPTAGAARPHERMARWRGLGDRRLRLRLAAGSAPGRRGRDPVGDPRRRPDPRAVAVVEREPRPDGQDAPDHHSRSSVRLNTRYITQPEEGHAHGHEARARRRARHRRRPRQGVLRRPGRLPRRPRPPGQRGAALRAAHPAGLRVLDRVRDGHRPDGARLAEGPAGASSTTPRRSARSWSAAASTPARSTSSRGAGSSFFSDPDGNTWSAQQMVPQDGSNA